MKDVLTYEQRELRARIVFAWLFLILVYFFLTHTLASQLERPATIYPGSDNSFWLLHLLNVPQYVMSHTVPALLFDIVLTCGCIICFIVPGQRFFTRIVVCLIWLLYVIYSSAAGKHYAQIGYLIPPVAFLAYSPERFTLLWKAVRYWICFLYVSAGFYKIYYGGFTTPANMQHILEQMNAEWLLFNREGLQYSCIRYLLDHPQTAQVLFMLATCCDLLLLVGFFTTRYDRLLLWALVLFHCANYFLLHISFVEQSLIFAPFLPWRKIDRSIQTNLPHD